MMRLTHAGGATNRSPSSCARLRNHALEHSGNSLFPDLIGGWGLQPEHLPRVLEQLVDREPARDQFLRGTDVDDALQ